MGLCWIWVGMQVFANGQNGLPWRNKCQEKNKNEASIWFWKEIGQDQAYARGLGVDFIGKINAYALQKYLPDVTIFIDLTPEAAFLRKKGADKDDRLELAGMAFHQKVYQGYKQLAAQEPERIVCIDGNKTPDGIFADVLKALKDRGIL